RAALCGVRAPGGGGAASDLGRGGVGGAAARRGSPGGGVLSAQLAVARDAGAAGVCGERGAAQPVGGARDGGALPRARAVGGGGDNGGDRARDRRVRGAASAAHHVRRGDGVGAVDRGGGAVLRRAARSRRARGDGGERGDDVPHGRRVDDLLRDV